MKKGVLGILVFLISLCFVAQAFAFNARSRVTIAPNGEGDLLIFPAYFTGGGWESEVTLINTSQDASLVVHVAVRRAKDSAERDFLVFLSPTDVFRMIIKRNEQDVPVVETSDGSLVLRNDGYSAADYTADHEGKPYQLELLDSNGNGGWEVGYITAVVIARSNDPKLSVPPVDKLDIYSSYITFKRTISTIPPREARWIWSQNELAGIIEVYNTQTNVRGVIKAFALKDYHNTYAPDFGETLELGMPGQARNSQIEIAAALANDKVVVPYVGAPNGITLFTAVFPVKYYNKIAQYTLYNTEELMGKFSPPLRIVCNNEMTQVVFPQDTTWGEPISRGWVLIDYDGTIPGSTAAGGAAVTVNDGIPAIHTVMHTLFGENNIQGVGWFYAPSQMGNIRYDGNPVSHYAPVMIPNPPCAPTDQFCSY